VQVVVLFGAGASYGAFDNPSQRPPLGNELFPKLAATFPETWGCLPEDVVADFHSGDSGFENGMAALREEAVHTQAALIDMGRFFASFRLLPGTNRYLAIVKFLQSLGPNVEFSFGSLNYETCLEQSLGRAGLGVLYWEQAPESDRARLVRVTKPHGSSNFVVDTDTNTFVNVRIVGGGSYVVGARLKFVPLHDVAKATESGFPPAMSLYAPGKPNLVCPEAVERLRGEWEVAVGAADVVVVIGARPMLESDPHIWRPIENSRAPIALIGSDYDPLKQAVRDRLHVIGDTFAAGLDPLKRWLTDRWT